MRSLHRGTPVRLTRDVPVDRGPMLREGMEGEVMLAPSPGGREVMVHRIRRPHRRIGHYTVPVTAVEPVDS